MQTKRENYKKNYIKKIAHFKKITDGGDAEAIMYSTDVFRILFNRIAEIFDQISHSLKMYFSHNWNLETETCHIAEFKMRNK